MPLLLVVISNVSLEVSTKEEDEKWAEEWWKAGEAKKKNGKLPNWQQGLQAWGVDEVEGEDSSKEVQSCLLRFASLHIASSS